MSNLVTTTISTRISETFNVLDTVLHVADTSHFSANGILTLGDYQDAEILAYTGKTVNSFTGLTRGQYGTAARIAFLGDVVVQNNLLGTASSIDTPIPMSSISAPVKSTVDAITALSSPAAFRETSYFATAAQGAKADTALQNAALFATASQGVKADTAIQTIKTVDGVSLLGTGDVNTIVDIPLSRLAPTTDEAITAGYSAVVVRKYTIASGKKLIIGSGARFRIL